MGGRGCQLHIKISEASGLIVPPRPPGDSQMSMLTFGKEATESTCWLPAAGPVANLGQRQAEPWEQWGGRCRASKAASACSNFPHPHRHRQTHAPGWGSSFPAWKMVKVILFSEQPSPTQTCNAHREARGEVSSPPSVVQCFLPARDSFCPLLRQWQLPCFTPPCCGNLG